MTLWVENDPFDMGHVMSAATCQGFVMLGVIPVAIVVAPTTEHITAPIQKASPIPACTSASNSHETSKHVAPV